MTGFEFIILYASVVVLGSIFTAIRYISYRNFKNMVKEDKYNRPEPSPPPPEPPPKRIEIVFKNLHKTKTEEA